MFVLVLSTDAMDVSGENQIDVDHNLFKQRLSLSGEKLEDEPEKEGIIHFHNSKAWVRNPKIFMLMPPTFKRLKRHIALGLSVCASLRPSVYYNFKIGF